MELEKVDLAILRELQNDGRLSSAKLAQKLALSDAPCWRRIKKLESEGYILGYQARLDRKKLGYSIIAYALVSFGDHAGDEPMLFEREVQAMANILECHNVAGECDYLLMITAPNLEQYGEFIWNQLRKMPGVSSVKSLLSMREVKTAGKLAF